ncbi:MAG: glycosyltransferase family 2 protein [Rhizomicrobium sp.]
MRRIDTRGYERLSEWGRTTLAQLTSWQLVYPSYREGRKAPACVPNLSVPPDRPRVSCILPAFNESGRIASVLSVVTSHPLIDEVIVIDDGSTDDTAHEAALFDGVRVIALEENRGKSSAVIEGLKAAQGTVLLLLDADLCGLTRENVTDLIVPVIAGAADMTISLRGNALWPMKLIGLDFVSGERVFGRDLVAGREDQIALLPGFGLEVFMNDLLLAQNRTLAIVRWENVFNPLKTMKYGIWQGMIGEIRMLMQIVETVSLIGTFGQIYALRVRARSGNEALPAFGLLRQLRRVLH